MRSILFTGSAVAALSLAAAYGGAAVAEEGCSAREKMVGHLEKKYGEKLRGAGLQSLDGLMELYVSDKGSWTLLLTRPDGKSCPVAVGEHWMDQQPTPAGEKA